MFACIIAFDHQSAPKLIDLVRVIQTTHPKAFIFFVEHVETNQFSNGALFNTCVQLAKFSLKYELSFFSFICNKWTISQRVSVTDFLESNGYNNHSVNAATLDKKYKKSCGYNEIFAETHFDIRYNPRCYHYIIKTAPDKILKLNFVQ